MGARPQHFTFTSPGQLRIWSTTELLAMDPPDWLITSIMPHGALVGLYSAPGSGKSFLAIDFALCVATGTPWQGRPVQKGFVMYVSAEGGTGIGKRVAAWLVEHGRTPADVNGGIGWITESIPVNADSEQMQILLQRIIELQETPVLVIIDTLARCFDGDENETQDMGRFIQGVDVLRMEYKCTVLVVHHTRLGGDRERGNTAFRAAADAMIAVEKADELITVTCTKQKDYEEFEPIELQLCGVTGLDSCVVKPFQAAIAHREKLEQVLQVLHEQGPMSWDQWKEAVIEAEPKTGYKDFYRFAPQARRQGLVEKYGKLWRVK